MLVTKDIIVHERPHNKIQGGAGFWNGCVCSPLPKTRVFVWGARLRLFLTQPD